jgi:predicted kinase
VPRLIVLNGPPAAGKSTLAALYVEEHPLALNLDVDRVRAMLGGWREDLEQAGLLAREIAVAAAQAHLTAGRDVVIPQLLANSTFLNQVERLAAELGADLHEVVLMDSKQNSLRRFRERGRAQVDPIRPEAQPAPTAQTGAAELSDLYDRLVRFVATRPKARWCTSSMVRWARRTKTFSAPCDDSSRGAPLRRST